MRDSYAWMAENMGKWPSGHDQLTKIRLSDGSGGKSILTAAQLEYDAMDLKPIWKMSVQKSLPGSSSFQCTTAG